MSRAVKLLATGSALPKKVMTNFDLEKLVETNDEWIKTRTGISERRICEEETCTSLAIEAARKAIENAEKNVPGFTRDKIGAVLVASSSGDRMLPACACLIQKELGLSENLLAYDMAVACSGFVFGVYTGAALMETHGMEYMMVVGSECLSKMTDFTDRSTCILFGDGAGAGIFTLKEEQGFVGTVGSQGNEEALGCKVGGKIYMDGQEVFRFATKTVTKVADDLLDRAQITMDEVDYVVCHQANARILEYVKRKYKGHEDKFYSNIERLGNTSAASIPIVLDEMWEKGMLTEGKKLLCIGFGGGLTYGGVLITT